MKRPTIFEANAFLQDPVRYRDFLVRNVASSCAIDGRDAAIKLIRV